MRINITYKIIFFITVIVAVILGSIYFYLNGILKEYSYQRVRKSLSQNLFLIKTCLQQNQNFMGTIDQMDAFADDIGKALNMGVTIIRADGTVLGDSQLSQESVMKMENHLYRLEVQKALDTGIGESRRFSTAIRKNMFYMATLLEKEPLKLVIRLAVPLSDEEIISYNLRNILFFSLLGAFILSIFFGILASGWIANPIKEISLTAQDMTRGDFTKKIRVRSNDEIGDLADAINYMSKQIKEMIEEATQGRSRLEAVLLSMFEGVMVVDQEGVILLMNETLKDFLRVSQEPIGKKPLEIIRNIEIQEMTDKVLSFPKGVEARELTVHFPEEKTLLIHATAVIRESKTDGAVLVFHDITDLRRLEKVRQDFVANVSHELRTPVATIKGFAETLLGGAIEDKKNLKGFLEIIHADSTRLANLVNDLLDLSQIESGKLKLDFHPCALFPIVDRIITVLDNRLKQKDVFIKTKISDDISLLKADEGGIAQVLLNLVENAIKYNKSNGSVVISAQEKDHFIEITVEDNGIGIPQEDIPRIFERFYRVDKARSRELGGTGLGLSIVKHIVQSHGGEVYVQSVLGKGSSFSFTIPKSA